MENNYLYWDKDSIYWDSLDMMRNYVMLSALSKEELLLRINNTIERGYIFIRESELRGLEEELKYYKRLH